MNSLSLISTVNDDHTAHHQHHVAFIECLITQQLGLSGSEVEGIRTAGPIHDIGKSAIPNELLTKSGQLNDEEFSLIKAHTSRAQEVLEGMEFPWQV